MSVVRGTALANYPSLVAGLGGDPATLLRAAGVRDQDVGNYDAFISIRAAIRAIESAAAVTATMDFGRRLAQRQGIEILGCLLTHLTLPTIRILCRSRWSPYH